MKKAASLLAAVLLSVSMLPGCGGTSSEQQDFATTPPVVVVNTGNGGN